MGIMILQFCFLVLVQLSIPALSAVGVGSNKTSEWQTLDGREPVVIARGGFSGLMPDSSVDAYYLAMGISGPNTILWCDVQLTKDGFGICLPDLRLDKYTDIDVYDNKTKTYLINGQPSSGMFSLDYTVEELLNHLSLKQGLLERSEKFDYTSSIVTVDHLQSLEPPGIWLNIQHDLFYREQSLSMKNYLMLNPNILPTYISSPEVGFLKSIGAHFQNTTTELVFRFLEDNMTEVSTNQTYASLMTKLSFIKTFASGILVPKGYIWPINEEAYLLPHTSLVVDAHKIGLKVFASEFANDAHVFAYNYSYDPLSEVLSFIDNGQFSVDGLLTDFPITASEAVGCFSHMDKNFSSTVTEKPLVISHNGASGVLPGCTDLAYKQAVEDGANIIDCSVQITKDGVLICLESPDLMVGTTVTTSAFSAEYSTIPDIKTQPGIYTFNFTWPQIQNDLKPKITNPIFEGYGLLRNPVNSNDGNFITLMEFLAFAKDSTQLSGILISIENAQFISETLGHDIISSVMKALSDHRYNNQTRQQVMIQSSHSSVLTIFKQRTSYKCVYKIEKLFGDVDSAAIRDMKMFADSVALRKDSIFPKVSQFMTGETKIVGKLQSANLSVYAYVLMNEYLTQPWDFYSDPIVQIGSYVRGALVDGLITDFPSSASAYKKNTCYDDKDPPIYMLPIQPGDLLAYMPARVMPPSRSPLPSLSVADVVEEPLREAGRNDSVGVDQMAPTPNGALPTTTPICLSIGALLLFFMIKVFMVLRA